MKLGRAFMPLALRQQVYAQIRAKLDALHERGKHEVDIEILLPKASIEFPVTEEAAGQRAFTRVARKLHYSVLWDQ